MNTTAATLSSLVALTALTADASAQPGAPAAPPPAQPQVVVVAPERPAYSERWGLGLHLGGMALASSDDPHAEEMTLGGGGVQVRLRISPRWSLQLDAGGYVTDADDDISLERELHIATVSARLHLRPGKTWDVYLLGGLGGAHEMVELDDRGKMVEAEFVHGVGHLGAGVEWRIGSFGLGAELRVMAMVRSDDEGDGPMYVGSDYPVPAETAGGQLTLGATYYF